MVKVGFVVEDHSFAAIIESDNFQEILAENGIEKVEQAFILKGNSNLTSFQEKTKEFFLILEDAKAEYIITISDLEDSVCITDVKDRIVKYSDSQINIIAVKTSESWFLADTSTLRELFNDNRFIFENPEDKSINPFEELNKLSRIYAGDRGITKRRNRHSKWLIRNGFSLKNSANHPNCPSAKYFLNKFEELKTR